MIFNAFVADFQNETLDLENMIISQVTPQNDIEICAPKIKIRVERWFCWFAHHDFYNQRANQYGLTQYKTFSPTQNNHIHNVHN